MSVRSLFTLCFFFLAFNYSFGQDSRVDGNVSDKLLYAVMRSAPTGIGVTKNRVIVQVNNYITELTGYSESELVGSNALMLYPSVEEYEHAGAEKYRKIAESGIGTVETKWKCADGRIIDVVLSSTPLEGSDLSLGVVFTVQDITERKRTENELRESERRFKALHEASFGGITIHDKGVIIECNQGLSEITGYSYDELIGMDGLLLISEKRRDMVLQNILSGYEEPYEALGVRKNGEEYPVRLHARNIPYKGKQVRTVEFRDITREKRLEMRIKSYLAGTLVLLGIAVVLIVLLFIILKRRKKIAVELFNKTEELDGFFSTALDLLSISDIDGNFIRVNKEWENTLGYSVDELERRKFFDFVHPDDMDATVEVLNNLSKQRKVYNFTNRYLCRDGSYRYIEWRSVPKGNLVYAAARDITARIESEKLIDAKNKELEQLIYVASHDLRSPLVNVDGYSREMEYSLKELTDAFKKELSKDDLVKTLQPALADMQDDVRHIRNSTTQMDALIKGLLKLSRIGRQALNIQVIDMNELFLKLKSAMEYQFKESRAELIIEDLPSCKADESQLTQLFNNLIVNALKYAMPGRVCRIVISGRVNGGIAVYTVEDNGMGIPEGQQYKIFELFHRLNPSKSEGEGLGLTIVRQIAGRLNGDVTVESSEGAGSKFIVSLPYSKNDLSGEALTKIRQ